MSCFCKRCRVERKKAKALAKEKAEMPDLPSYILSNYKRKAAERRAEQAEQDS